MSFYECLKAFPEGAASASRMALAAKRLGYQGIITCNQEPHKLFRPDACEKIGGIEVILGTEVVASNPKVLRSRISALRPRYPFLMVRAGNEEMIRAACEDPNVDLLLHPCDIHRPLGIATARAARQNQVAIGFDLSPVLYLYGQKRSRWLEASRRNLLLARKFELLLIITMCASSHLDLRGPRDIMALAELAGFEPEEAKEALRRPGALVEQNRRNWLGPGVELL
ncbi:Ribonuclease P protein component 3 [uncultured archaeon]|nr:Ribonuclease P protein component 3 [uncultured archaeon]